MNMTTMRKAMICIAASCFMLTAITIAAESAEMRVARVTGNGVNMRSEPSTSGKKVASLSNSDLLLVMEEKKGDKHPWYGVMAKGAVEGWVYGQYVGILPEGDRSQVYDEDAYSLYYSFHDAMLEGLPGTVDEAKKRFGNPLSEEHTPVPSDHDPSIIVDYYTLDYPGFELLYYETSFNSGLLGVELREPGLTLGKGVKIGADVAVVVQEAGVPLLIEQSSLFWTDESDSNQFYVTLDGRRITSIKTLTWLD